MGTAWGDGSNCLSERMKSESIPSLKSAQSLCIPLHSPIPVPQLLRGALTCKDQDTHCIFCTSARRRCGSVEPTVCAPASSGPGSKLRRRWFEQLRARYTIKTRLFWWHLCLGADGWLPGFVLMYPLSAWGCQTFLAMAMG